MARAHSRKSLVALGSFGFVAALSLSGCEKRAAGPPEAAPVAAAPAAPSPVERGKYLVTILGCNDCHRPYHMGPNGIPEPDMTKMLSGHPEGLKMPPAPKLPEGPWLWVGAATNTAFAGPWGVTYSINLTPDQNTGIGIWTEDMFVRAIKSGKHMGTSRMIQPPMPWPWYNKMTDEDLKSIYAYLRTIPAWRTGSRITRSLSRRSRGEVSLRDHGAAALPKRRIRQPSLAKPAGGTAGRCF